MKLFVLVLCIFALSTSVVNAAKKEDRNFVVAYKMSTVLQKTAFSRILDETFEFTGQPKYINKSCAIDHQLKGMMEEAMAHLPSNVTDRLINMAKRELKNYIPMLEVVDHGLITDLNKAIRKDIERLGTRMLRLRVIVAHALNISSQSGNHANIGGIVRMNKLLNRIYVFAMSRKLHLHDTPLLENVFTLLDMWSQLPRISIFQKYLCEAAMDPAVIIYDVIGFSKELFFSNFDNTKSYIDDLTRKNIIKHFLKLEPVKRMVEHFHSSMSYSTTNITTDDVKTFFLSYGTKLLEVKLRIMLDIIFRPNGTFTRLEDFEPYIEMLKPIFNELPKEVQALFAGFKNLTRTVNYHALFDELKYNNTKALVKRCLATFDYLPKEVIERLRARQNFASDAEIYCEMVTSLNAKFLHMAYNMPHRFIHMAGAIQLPPEYINYFMATFAPGNVHYIACRGSKLGNPLEYYHELHSRFARQKLKAAVEKSVYKSRIFPTVRSRVPIVNRAIFGVSACGGVSDR